MAEHPNLKFELDLTERLADPVAERLDLVIRMGELQDSSLIATKIAPLARILVASRDYLGRCGEPRTAEELCGHQRLDKLHGNDLLGWSDILAGHPGEREGDRIAFRSDDFEALNSAALAGMGIALLPSWVAGPSVQAGDLIRISLDGEPWNQRAPGIYMLRALQVPSAKLRVFMDALKTHVGTPPIWEP
jgi:DNA-binding transcriptional LysR family regulator